MNEQNLSRTYKALYFDLHVKSLKKYFSRINPNRAYREIRNYLLSRNFSHEQYSGYHSKYKTTDMDIFALIRDMRKAYGWLELCLKHFEVTDIGPDYDLMQIFREDALEIFSPE